MALLHSHLQQISLSAAAIADLPFPPPKIFANAMLRPHDITTLIRDTEPHERALFSIDPASSSSRHANRRATRRGTMFPAEAGDGDSMASRIYAAKNNKNQSAVAQVLGGDMMDEIKRSTGAASGRAAGAGINVDVLLRGAEMLCSVYPIAGAPETIATLRQRHYDISNSIAHLEDRVAEQSAQLERMNLAQSYDYEIPEPVGAGIQQDVVVPEVTEEDLQRELQEIRELELRKRTLESRVTGMERDLGGLMR
ncbi:hypothetical protein FQN55_000189 [Onygenales sp. PD_40]|nr:hypothetical protein FQN55_000189 [Onygenales sp. PD_40]